MKINLKSSSDILTAKIWIDTYYLDTIVLVLRFKRSVFLVYSREESCVVRVKLGSSQDEFAVW